MRYRTKSTTIEAHQWQPHERPELCPPWLFTLAAALGRFDLTTNILTVPTRDGTTPARPGDYVIRHHDGYAAVMEPSLFAALFEAMPADGKVLEP